MFRKQLPLCLASHQFWTTGGNITNHDASSSAIGYLYQVRWALLEFIKSSESRPDSSLALERFDDVSWEDSGGNPEELLQLKHHKYKLGSLTDKSDDIWRTLKVWMDDPQYRLPNGPDLSIVTTARAPDGSAAANLRHQARDVGKASKLLNEAASSSENSSTEVARSQWTNMQESERLTMLRRIYVLDHSPAIGDLTQRLEDAIWIIAPRGRQSDFLEALDAWWIKVSVDLLRKKRKTIRVQELKAKLDDVRDKFLPDNLVTTVPRIDGEEVLDRYGQHPFVHQLDWVGATRVALKVAVADFHRAVAQTTDWVDRDLIEMTEFDEFKHSLIDEWEIAFDDMLQDLPADAAPEERKKAGLDLFRKLRDSTAVQVRPRYTEAFYARGIRHEIADAGSNGWHPDFANLVKTLTIGDQ